MGIDPVIRRRLDKAARALAKGELQVAWDSYMEILSNDPDQPEALRLSGLCAFRGGERELARKHLQKALEIAPKDPQSWKIWATLCRDSGDQAGYMEALEQAVALRPGYRSAVLALGDAHLRQGTVAAAIDAYGSLSRDPEALLRRGEALLRLNRSAEALEMVHAAMDLLPDRETDPASHRRLSLIAASANTAVGQLEEARGWLSWVVDHWPEDPDAVRLSARVEVGLGYRDRAQSVLAGLAELFPVVALERMALPLRAALPGEMATACKDVESTLERVDQDGVILPDPDALSFGPALPWMAAQGVEDAVLRRRMAAVLRARCPGLTDPEPVERRSLRPASARSPRRVLVLARDWSAGSAGHMLVETLASLMSETALDLRLATPLPVADGADGGAALAGLEARLGLSEGQSLHLPRGLVQARALIKAAQPDVLVAIEPVSDPLLWMLLQSRLAARQWVWAPVTGALPQGPEGSLDGVLGAEAFAAPAGVSASGVALPGLGLVSPREVPPVADRAKLALPQGRILYFCPIDADSVHPECDAVFAAILKADPDGALCLFRSGQAAVTERLEARMVARGVPRSRLIWLHRRARAVRMAAVAVVDVVLDGLHRDMGPACLPVLGMGVPTVSLPPLPVDLGAGRVTTAGVLAHVGLSDLVAGNADDYVRMAVAWGRDSKARAAVAERLLAVRGRLSGPDPLVTRALRDALLRAG